MGDVALTTHLPRLLKRKYPEAAIDFATSAPYEEILKYNPQIRKLFLYDKSIPMPQNRLNLEKYLSDSIKKYDLIIDMQNNLRSKHLSSGLGDSMAFSPKYRLNKLAMVFLKNRQGFAVPGIPHTHMRTAGIDKEYDDGHGLEIRLPGEAASAEYKPFKKKYEGRIIERIAIAPGAKHETKKWPVEHFIELSKKIINKTGAEIILIGGKDDIIEAGAIKKSLGFNADDCTGAPSILETLDILDSCDMLITNDSGPAHLAAARKTPLMTIFGSTVPEFGFMPFRVPQAMAQVPLSCRPCTHIGRKKCPKGHFNCMKSITADNVFDNFVDFCDSLSYIY